MTQATGSSDEHEDGVAIPPRGSVDIVTDIGFGPRGNYDEDPLHRDGEKLSTLAYLWRILRTKPGRPFLRSGPGTSRLGELQGQGGYGRDHENGQE